MAFSLDISVTSVQGNVAVMGHSLLGRSGELEIANPPSIIGLESSFAVFYRLSVESFEVGLLSISEY